MSDQNRVRTATITYRDAVAAAADLMRVRAYLPRGYSAGTSDARIIITGRDDAGWTLDGYVIPRLASGLIFAEEVIAEPSVLARLIDAAESVLVDAIERADDGRPVYHDLRDALYVARQERDGS